MERPTPRDLQAKSPTRSAWAAAIQCFDVRKKQTRLPQSLSLLSMNPYRKLLIPGVARHALLFAPTGQHKLAWGNAPGKRRVDSKAL
jgi:hypothetical protein